jgi:hypothetical protein
MRYLYALLVSILFISILQAQERQEPIRLCVAMLKNSSPEFVDPAWQRNELIKAFERINKSKDVKKGKAAPIEAISLESSDEPDTDVRDKDCKFVLHTNLTRIVQLGGPKISIPQPSAVEVATGPGDPRAYPADFRDATVEYRVMRVGNQETWTSGLVTGNGQLSEDTLVSQLMDQVANRVAGEIRKPHSQEPQ